MPWAAPGRGRWGSEFEASLVYAERSRLAYIFRPRLKQAQKMEMLSEVEPLRKQLGLVMVMREGTGPVMGGFQRHMPSTTVCASSGDTLGCHRTLEAEGNL